ncbi:SET and MYND domain-containing protein 4 [Hippoglossus stenolepis]|uniref:SET and MYND domain-containing protein 4 n=1 Tax=Hippoglossus stenolepis TaxID=195615 RepID=UPI00159C72D4|nr:SET and MYND domain-containing protein 4 [Hippoglossus stenolepis]
MDLPCVQWQDHVAQKWTRLDPESRERFTSLVEVDDVFKCASTLTTQDDLDFLESICDRGSAQKDTERAAKCREKGNCSFKSRDYTAAALHYSQGVCSAPLRSEQLPLCYANRSAALYHLQLYQDCLNDIDRALKNGYPSHLLHKLEERRTQCLKHVSGGQDEKDDRHGAASKNHQGPDRAEAPSVLTSEICPQATVGFSPEKGRHLVAVQGIAAGEVILTDRPYSCVLIPGVEEVQGRRGGLETERGGFGTEHRRCHRCLSETLCPLPCDGCSYSRYCSSDCQQDAWEEHHQWECPLGADLMVMGVMSQLALRATLKAGLKNIQTAREPIRGKHTKSEPDGPRTESSDTYTNQPDPAASHYGDSYLSVFHLLHHLNRHSPALRFLNAVTIATLFRRLSETGPPPASWTLSGPPAAPEEDGGNADWSTELWLMGSAVLRHMLQLRCNAQAIVSLQDAGATNSPVQSRREIRIATAIFPTLSLLNHSCCPNTSLAFSTGAAVEPSGSDPSADLSESVSEPGVTVTVRAAKVIDAGQEILHCYGPHSSRMVTRKRQHLLQEQYYFLCQCEACSRTQEEGGTGGGQQRSGGGGTRLEEGLLCFKCKGSLKRSGADKGTGFMCSQSSCCHRVSSSEVSLMLQEIRVDLEKAVDLMERERPDEALRLLSRTQCQAARVLAETHPLQGELADAMARAYATVGDWDNAASHLERSAIAIGSQYGDDSIELGQQLFKLAQLHFNGGARGPALSLIPEVSRLLRLHSGPHCPELQELQAMEDCLRG